MISTIFKRRMFTVLLTTSSLCPPTPAPAQIAAADKATTVYTNPNGVPVVDIAAPNAGGLSHNRYTDYNVDGRGVVLNNGTVDAVARQSQLAGQVLANTNLSNTAARVILNEVVSTNRSTLAGFTEVLGGRADVIVANPYGVTCNGCGFINAPNVVLTTGKPQIGADGTVTGFAVTGGDLLVTGAGLNATGQDYLALLARRVTVQGAVNGKAVDIVGGAHDFDLATRTARARAATADTPIYAIDSSALGGMYANRIRLIVTEAGAGVRMAGDMAASGGDFTLDAAGQVELSGSLSASGAVRAGTTGSRLALTGATTTAGEGLALVASAGTVALTGGVVSAGRDIAVTAAALVDQAAASGATRSAKAGIALTIAGAGTAAGTTWRGDGAVTANLGSLALTGGTLSGSAVTLATTGDLMLAATGLRAGGAATLTAGGMLGVDGTVQSLGGDVALSGVTAVTQSGAVSADRGAVTVASRGSFAAAGVVQAARGLMATAGSFDIGGSLLAGDALSATALGAIANRGTIQAAGTTTLSAASLRNVGTVSAGTGLTIAGADVANTVDGVIQSKQAMLLAGLGSLQNDGRIIAGTDLTLTGSAARVPSVVNGAAGVLQATGMLAVTNGGVVTQSGKMLAADIKVAAASVQNAGVTQADRTLAIVTTDGIGNTGLLIGRTSVALNAATALGNAANIEGDRLALTAATLDNGGAVKGGTSLALTAGTATNAGALIANDVGLAVGALTNAASGTVKAVTGDLTLSGAGSIANAGLLLAARNLSTAAAGTRIALINGTTGAFQAAGTLALNGVGMLTQAGGLLGGAITLDAADAANTGLIQSSGTLDAAVAGTLANSGTIVGAGATSLAAGTITNGAAIRGGSLKLAAAGALGNTGTVYTEGILAVTAATLDNGKAGGLQGSAGTMLTAATVTNAGQIVTAAAPGASGTVVADALVNTGSIVSAGNLGLTLSGSLDNGGTLLAQSALAIEAAAGRVVTFANRTDAGAIKAGTALTFGGGGTLSATIGGGLVSGGTIAGTLAGLTNAGTMQAVRTLGLTITGDAANSGTLIAGEALALGGGTLANTGLVQSNGTGTLAFATLTNNAKIYGLGTTLAVDAGRLTNAAGATLYAARALALTGAAAIDNAGSLLADTMAIDAGGTGTLALTNRATGEIKANVAVTFTVGAGKGAVALTQDGTLAAATLALVLDSYQGAGSTTAGDTVALSASNGASNAGLLRAGGVLTLGGSSFFNTGEVSASGSSVTVDGFANRGLFTAARDATGTAAVTARTFNNSGTFQSQGAAALTVAGALTNANVILSTGTLALTAGGIANTGGIQGAKGATIVTKGLLDNTGGTIVLSTDAAIGGSIAAATVTNGTGITAGSTAPTGGTIQSAGGAEIDADRLANTGLIYAGGPLVLDGRSGGAVGVSNAGDGEIRSLAAMRIGAASGTSHSTLSVTGGVVYGNDVTLNLDQLTNAGWLQSDGALAFAGTTLRNSGTVLALGRSDITASTFDNSGTFDSRNAATIVASTVRNSKLLVLSRADATGTITAQRLDNAAGATLYGKGDISLRIDGQIANAGQVIGEGQLRAYAVAGTGLQISNIGSGASIYAARDVTLGVDGRTVELQTDKGSQLVGASGLTVWAGGLRNRGLVQAADLTLNARTLDNDGALVATRRLAATIAADLRNAGTVQAAASRITADRIDNVAAGILNLATDTAGTADLAATTISNAGHVQSLGDLRLTGARSIENTGEMYAGRTLDIRRSDTGAFDLKLGGTGTIQARLLRVDLPTVSIVNAGQVLVDRLDLTLGSLTNTGVLQATGDARIALGTGDFTNVGTVYSGAATSLAAGNLYTGANTQFQAVGGLTASVAGLVDNKGTLFAGQGVDADGKGTEVKGTLSITAAAISNTGRLASIGDGQLRVSGTLANAAGATIYGKNNLTIGGTGTMAASLLNADGGIIYAGGLLDITSTADRRIAFDHETVRGTIYGGDLTIAVDTLVNRGVIQSDRIGTIAVATDFANEGGTIFLGANADGPSGGSITANTFMNQAIIESNGSLQLFSRHDFGNGSDAQIIAGKALTFTGLSNDAPLGNLTNSGLIQSSGLLTVSRAGGARFGDVTLSGAKARMIAGSASLTAGTLLLGAGNTISTSGAVSIDATTLTLASATSRIVGGTGTSSVTVGSALNVVGAIYADGDLTVHAPLIDNGDTGALAAGGTLDIATTDSFTNTGTVFANNLKLVAGSYFINARTDTGTGTIDTINDAAITTPEFENNARFQIGHDLTITATTIKNQITGGDTRIDTAKAAHFVDAYTNQGNDNRVGADGETAAQKDQKVSSGADMNYSATELANANYNAAYGDTWQSTKTQSPVGILGDTSWNYHATFETRVYWDGDAPTASAKPQLLANGKVTFKDFTDLRNLGGTISAQAIVFDARAKDANDPTAKAATIVNDALDTTIVYWVADWTHKRICSLIYGCYWQYFDSYNKKHDPDHPSVTTSLGATISAGSVVFTNGAAVTQRGATTYSDKEVPKAIAPEKTSRDGGTGGTVGAGATRPGAPGGTAITDAGGTRDVALPAATAPNASATAAVDRRDAAAPGAGLSVTPGSGLKDPSTTGSAIVGVRVDVAAVTNAGTTAQHLDDLADRGTPSALIQAREAQNAAALTQSPLQAVTASDGRTSLSFAGVTVALPTSPNARYVQTVDAAASYLIESNPIYGIGASAYSSDFIAQRLGLNPDILQRRLGDAAYETFLVTQQVVAQTGAASIVRAETTDQQYARLMVQAVDQASGLGLVYGRALTATQVANLKQDMVWMVLTEVKGQKVLAPVVYLSAATKAAFDPRNASIAGDVVDATLSSLSNTGGTVTGSTLLSITSTGDIVNRSGTMTGGNVSVISTQGSIINQTLTTTAGSKSVVAPIATITATKALTLDAAKDISVRGGTVNAGTDASLKAGRDITFTTVDKKSTSYSQDGSTTVSSTAIQQIGSGLNVGGDLTLNSGRDTTFKATDATIAGNADVTTGRNFNILAGQNSVETSGSSERSGAGVGGGVYGTEKTTTTTFIGRNVSSNFNVGGDAKITSAGDMTVQGSTVNVTGNADLDVSSLKILQGNDVDRSTTTTDTKTYLRTSGSETGKAGAKADASVTNNSLSEGFSHGAGANAEATAGITGKGDLEVMNKTTVTTTEEHSRAVGSGFNVGGNATVKAVKDVTLQGSTLDAKGDVVIDAANINLLAAENRDVVTTTTDSNSVGLMAESANEAEAKAKAEASQNMTAQAKATAGVKAESDNTVDLFRNQQSTTTQTDITHTGSLITSGGSTSLTASKTLNVQGSGVNAVKDVNLDAKDMTFGAVDDVHDTTTTTQRTGVGLYGNVNGDAKAGGNAGVLGGKVGANAAAEGSAGVQVKHVTTTDTSGYTTAVTSSITSGGDISRTATNKITDVGTTINAGGDLNQTAKEWDSKAARDTTYSKTVEQTDKARIGAYTDADAGIQRTVGLAGDTGKDTGASLGGKVSYSHEDTTETDNTGTARVSTITTGGKFTGTTTGRTSLEGTAIDAGKDASLTAGSLDYGAARNTEDSTSTANKGEGSAKLGIDAAKAVKASGEASYEGEQGKANSSQAVTGQMTSGGNLTVRTTQGDAAFEGTKLNSAKDTLIDSAGAVNMTAARDTGSATTNKEEGKLSVSATGEAAGVEAEGGFSHEKTTSDTAVVGSATSGGTLTVKAANDITLEGTTTASGGKTSLDAGGNLDLKVAKDTNTKVTYGGELSASAERSKKPEDEEGGDAGAEHGKDHGDAADPAKPGDAAAPPKWTPATPTKNPSKPGDAATPSTIKPGDAATPSKWTPATPTKTPSTPGDAATPATKPGDAVDGGQGAPAAPTGTTPVTTKPRSGDAGNSQTATSPTPAPATKAPGSTGPAPTTTAPATPVTPASTTPASNAGDASGNGGTPTPAPTKGWTKATPTQNKPPETTTGDAEPGDGALPKGPEWEKSGGAAGGATYGSSSNTTSTGPTITSGDGVTLKAQGDVTKENTVINGPVETTAGGQVKDVTVDDSHSKLETGGSVGGQSTKPKSGAGTNDTIK